VGLQAPAHALQNLLIIEIERMQADLLIHSWSNASISACANSGEFSTVLVSA
jgi:hypothetical protein